MAFELGSAIEFQALSLRNVRKMCVCATFWKIMCARCICSTLVNSISLGLIQMTFLHRVIEPKSVKLSMAYVCH